MSPPTRTPLQSIKPPNHQQKITASSKYPSTTITHQQTNALLALPPYIQGEYIEKATRSFARHPLAIRNGREAKIALARGGTRIYSVFLVARWTTTSLSLSSAYLRSRAAAVVNSFGARERGRGREFVPSPRVFVRGNSNGREALCVCVCIYGRMGVWEVGRGVP